MRGYTHRLHSSSFWGLPCRILNINHKKGTTMQPMGKGIGVRVLRPKVAVSCAFGTSYFASSLFAFLKLNSHTKTMNT